jgi:RHS repeat-associated protein
MPHLPAPLSYDSGAYLYDGSGNIKAINTDRYVYDAAGRLTYGAASRHSGLGQTYTYDAFGNMTSIDGGSGPSTFGVDPSTNRISLHTNPSTGAGYNTYADYDAAGNITSITGSVASTYDAAGMMSQFRGGNYYLYTAGDERIATRSSDGTLYSWTLRDPSEKVLREYSETVSSSGGVFTSTWIWKRDYVYRDGVLFAAVTLSGTSEVKQHYHVDHLGTPRLITDSAGVQKYAYDYYAFGKDAAFNTGDPEALHFTGHERDYESGTAAPNTDYLDYMHARYYSSNLGRFLSVDPVLGKPAQPQWWNRYSYVMNNPVNRTDPDGRCIWDVCIGEAALVLAGSAAIATTVGVWLNHPSPNHPGRTNAQVIAGTITTVATVIRITGQTLMESKDKAGSSGGETAGKRFPQAVQGQAADEARDQNGQTHCQNCGVPTSAPGTRPAPGEVKGNTDHIVPGSHGGNATLDNAQHTCETCNKSAQDNPKPKTTGADKLKDPQQPQ